MAAVFGDTGRTSLMGSKVIWDRASDGSVWSVNGFSDPWSDAIMDANCV